MNLSRRARLAIGGLAATGAVGALGIVATTPNTAPAAAAACTVAAAGDIAGGDDYKTGAAKSGALIIAAKPAKVIAVGDLAYDSGTVDEFKNYYTPTWGAFAPDTEAVPGNHEGTSTAGITSAVGTRAVNNRGVDVCGWRVVLVNQYKGVAAGASFIAAERKAHPSAPMIVVWHAPWRTSGSEHGTSANPDTAPLWKAAVAARARIVLNGHDHDYERFAPMDATGTKVASGTREFVTGLGGHHIRTFGTVRANSEKRYTGAPAVLFLGLNADGSYTWSEKSADGVVRDSGTQAALTGSTPAPSASTTTSPVPTSTSTPTSSSTSTTTAVPPAASATTTSAPTSTTTFPTAPTSSSSSSTSSASTSTPLSISGTSDRANPVPVPRDGSLTVKGNVFFFVPTTATTQAKFRVDAGATITESLKPYDAQGTATDGAAKPLVTTALAEGKHTITVDSVSPDTPATTYTFTVDNVVDGVTSAPTSTTPEPTTTAPAPADTVTPGPGPSETTTPEPTVTDGTDPSAPVCLTQPADPALQDEWDALVAAA